MKMTKIQNHLVTLNIEKNLYIRNLQNHLQ